MRKSGVFDRFGIPLGGVRSLVDTEMAERFLATVPTHLIVHTWEAILLDRKAKPRITLARPSDGRLTPDFREF